MKNLEIAKIFYEIADILEMQNVQWKPRAYRKAATALEALSKDVEEVYKSEGKKGLEEIPGVGEGLAKKIIQYIETGKINEYERLKKTIPEGLSELMEVEGMGPKKAMALYKKLKIKNVKDLEKATKTHRLRTLSGFGEKSEENILKSLKIHKEGKQRALLGVALPIAQEIISELKKVKGIRRISMAGSLRRMSETIGDIDILVTSQNPQPIMNKFVTLPNVKRILAKGLTKSSVILQNGMQSDVRIVKDGSFGAAMQYFTGSKNHNIRLREIAIKKGLKLSEYGLFKKIGNKLVEGKNEEKIYERLGLQYIEPELRENIGEIEYAKRKQLPKLVELKDINGDLHIHSKWSDGNDEIKAIAEAAKKIGYQYIGICDHSKAEAIAHGLGEEELIKQIKEIKSLDGKGIKIFAGSEVDILSDGSLDYSDSVLKKLDIVTAAVHRSFKLNKKAMTNRIIKALENPYVKILAHPTGRIIHKREPYEFDFEQVLEVAKEKKKFLEINAFPDRLDLRDSHIKMAVENGVKLVIGTDAHSIDQFHLMQFGVAQARRGWAQKKDILNTLSLKELSQTLP